VTSVDTLREQLRERGYLRHGIERWFALDPWSSRAFWLELATVALKAALLIAVFGALPPSAITLLRNYPLTAFETFGLFFVYALAGLVVAYLFVVLIALVLKLRPELAIDTPRALLAISLGAAALMTLVIALWWYRFDARPETIELAIGLGLCVIFFLVATIVVSAALLSFSIYELHRIPAIHQKPRGFPMAVAAAVLIALLFGAAYATREQSSPQPMIVTSPTTRRVALIAVDGLTYELYQTHPIRVLPMSAPAAPIPGASTTERWASIGTGVPTEAHGVRAIEGVRFRFGRHVLQRLSRGDVVLHDLAPFLGIARREPLPPTVRRRDYVWEIFAGRGLPSLAVNWWTTADAHEGALESIAQGSIFSAAQANPRQVDTIAAQRFLDTIDKHHPQFATVYLPALDIVLNRVELDPTTRLTTSLRVFEDLHTTVMRAAARGYDVVLIGVPGEGQQGLAVIASTLPLQRPASAWDVAATTLDLLGFPLSTEMPGYSRARTNAQPRIASYGPRQSSEAAAKVNEEYYRNLKSLGYIR